MAANADTAAFSELVARAGKGDTLPFPSVGGRRGSAFGDRLET